MPPGHVVDYLALIGDSSDNIPGARGIGPKTAIQLIEQYGAGRVDPRTRSEISGKARARIADPERRRRAALQASWFPSSAICPIELDLERVRVREPDRERLRELFIDLEFTTLVRDFAPTEEETGKRVPAPTTETVVDVAGCREASWSGRASAGLRGPRCRRLTQAHPCAASWSGPESGFEPGERSTCRWATAVSGLGLDDRRARTCRHSISSMQPLVEVLEDATMRKVGHNLKHDLLVLRGPASSCAGWTSTR